MLESCTTVASELPYGRTPYAGLDRPSGLLRERPEASERLKGLLRERLQDLSRERPGGLSETRGPVEGDPEASLVPVERERLSGLSTDLRDASWGLSRPLSGLSRPLPVETSPC